MRRKRNSTTTFVLLTAALVLYVPVSSLAESPYHGMSGDGYRCEADFRDPDPISYDNLGSKRAVQQTYALNGDFLGSIRDFSYKTAAAVLKDSQENINYSPVSLYYALSLVAQGAGGDTRTQLFQLLETPDQDLERLGLNSRNLYQQMYRNNEYAKIKLTNSLWLQDGLPLDASYRRAAENKYYATVFRVDFASEKTPGIMGQWMAAQTRQTPAPEITVTQDEVMRLINAIYFHDQWLYEFEQKQNVYAPFYRADGQEATCEYMTGLRSCSYYQGDGFLRATMSMKNGTMMFILPDQSVSVQSLISSEERMNEVLGYAAESFGQISWKIPKFRFQTSLPLKSVLEGLGLTEGFDVGKADFSGINGERLFLSDVTQNTQISINEQGVEASGFTSISMGAGSAAQKTVIEMNLERPFLYVIEGAPGVPLFIGVCNNPDTGLKR